MDNDGERWYPTGPIGNDGGCWYPTWIRKDRGYTGTQRIPWIRMGDAGSHLAHGSRMGDAGTQLGPWIKDRG